MAILHYTIGLPPYRHGGSVQYAYDLMHEQSKQGYDVIALICGDTLFRGSICRIKRTSYSDNIPVFKLTNPLTPTLIYGVSNPESQHRNVKVDVMRIKQFIKKFHINIIHFHTFMGMHYDVLKVFKEEGVKIIYTTHDFHGICPHYDLINYKGELCKKASGADCARCNIKEPSDNFLRIANSFLYQSCKRLKLLKFLKQQNKVSSVAKEEVNISEDHEIHFSTRQYEAFDELIEYYRNMFRLVDTFHFNSKQTETVFKQFLPNIKGQVIPVMTRGISDSRKELKPTGTIKFGFIGNTKDYKGFPMLLNVAEKLRINGNTNFNILVYGSGKTGIDGKNSLIQYMPSYSYSELSDVLYNLDCIIVPSKCYETFSLVTLEALSHGRPVIVSSQVGAKDIVSQFGENYIFGNEHELENLMLSFISNPEELLEYNRSIIDKPWTFSIEKHVTDIIDMYTKN